MKIYLARRFGRREELRQLRDELVERGHEVTSRWLEEPVLRSEQDRVEWCLRDIEDVLAADVMVNFTEAPDSTNGKRGGRHVEFGIALQAGKRLIVVGWRENLFYHHPRVEFCSNDHEMRRALGLLQVTIVSEDVQ